MSSGRIAILPDEVINKVAAGEVVERPAAALKELVENSLDAGARGIDVTLTRAGKGRILVRDDGAGMTHDELLLALERHSTSKIRSVEDLDGVGTLGFRGEAVPSIAAVSKMRITTSRGGGEGTRVRIEGGRVRGVTPCGAPAGTEVEVRSLFYNVPARTKFLKTDATELGHCARIVAGLALAHPAAAFTIVHGARRLLSLPAAGDAAARLRDYLGDDFFGGLVPVGGSNGPLRVGGFLSRPGRGRRGQEYQQFFVNGRPVRDPFLLGCIREATGDYFRKERAPAAFFLWIEIPAAEVDVNVHPTKREVRFRDTGSLRTLLVTALRGALRGDRVAALALPPPARPATAGFYGPPAAREGLPGTLPYRVGTEARAAQLDLSTPAPPAAAAEVPAGGTSQLFDTYLVAIRPEGLVIVDQHAAHERIIYEKVLARGVRTASQGLLYPIAVETTPAEEKLLEGMLPALSESGIDVEPFGPRAFRVTSLPPELPPPQAEAFLRDLLDAAREGLPPHEASKFREKVAALVACHGSVRAGQRLDPRQAAALLHDLFLCNDPGHCPHGRPTVITIERLEIEKRFRRRE